VYALTQWRRLGPLSAIPALVTSEMPFIVGYLLIASTVLALAEGDLASAGGQAGGAVAVRQALERDEEAIACGRQRCGPI
jgi:hypothetical protein